MLEANEQYDLFDNAYSARPHIDRDKLAAALQARMSGMSLDQIVNIMTDEYQAILEYIALSQGANTCQKTSLLFNPHRLDTRTSTSTMSIYQAIRAHPTFHSGLARATILNWTKGYRPSEFLYLTLQLGINGIQYCNEFHPYVARDLCKRYMLSSDSKILDPCAGWGGRMIGCSVVCNLYECYEPASRTAAGLRELAVFLGTLRAGNFSANVHCQPYEESPEMRGFYDFALTSPPYYDSEIYSTEPTNSLNKYGTFREWCNGFYKPLIDKTMRQLKKGGVFVINIGDRRWPLTAELEEHCAARGYLVRQIKANMVDSGGFGREHGAGEKFFEISRP